VTPDYQRFICGWFGKSVTQNSGPLLRQMAQHIMGDSTGTTIGGKSFTTITSSPWHTSIEDYLYCVVSGHPYLAGANSDTKNPAITICHAYQRNGIEFLNQLRGDFSLVLFDARKQKLLLAIDRIGTHHIFYAPLPSGVIFSSSARGLCFHPQFNAEIDPQGIFNYLYFHSVPSPSSIFRGAHKLKGGQYLICDNSGIQRLSYWEPNFQEPSTCNIKELGEELLATLENATQRFCDGTPVGSFLSGGLDSSTVSGMLARVQPDNAHTFTIGFDVKGYDETEYARIASNHFGTSQHEHYVTPKDVLNAVPKIVSAFDEPFGNSSALPAYFCAKMAKDNGVSRLLAGDGGDEIFAGNERYAKQAVFNRYQQIPILIRQLLLEPLFLGISSLNKLPVSRKVASYIRQAKQPLPDRMESYNFLHRILPLDIFNADFLQHIDPEQPLSLLREQYNHPSGATTLNRMLYLDWNRTLHDNDLVKVNQMCSLAGIEVVYPMLDDKVIELSCRIPSDMKMKNNTLRWFYKEAIKNFLPTAIINKQKHGFGLPFGIWTKEYTPLQELAYDNVLKLKKRNYFSSQFIDQAINIHKSGHASYYGELVWILMMLELWLDGFDNSQHTK